MEKFCHLLAMLRAAQIIHQTSHWVVKGQTFGSDHELLDEAYSPLAGQYDKLGELLVMEFGDDAVDEDEQCDEMCALVAKWVKVKDRFARSVAVEKDIQAQIKRIVDAGGVDVGFDNFLRGLAEAHKHPVQYKLEQRVK